jgi:SAM-dependent methyltransferase
MTVPLVRRCCPVCGPDGDPRPFAAADVNVSALGRFAFASRKEPEYMHWRLWECRRCDVLYADPAPDPDWLRQRYREADFASGVEAAYAARTYALLLNKVLNRLPDRNGAVDIGAGDGAFLTELVGAGFKEVWGIEPSAAPVAAAAPSVRCLLRQDVFRPGLLPPEHFRLVSCFQTIEHASDPLGICREALRLLKPGGVFLVVAHNRRACSAWLLGRRSPIYDVEHLQLFSRASLRHLLRTAGFCEFPVRTLLNCYPLSYWARLLPLPAALKRSLQALLKGLALERFAVPLPAGNLAAFAFKSLSGSAQEFLVSTRTNHGGSA